MRVRARVSLIFGILIFLYLTLPYFFGMAAEHSAKRFLNQENQTIGNALGLSFSFRRYERGWFHSEAILSIRDLQSTSPSTAVKDIPLTITHGPLYQRAYRPMMGLAMVISDPIIFDAFPKYAFIFRDDIGFSRERAVFALISPSNTDMPSVADANYLKLAVSSNYDADDFRITLRGNGLRYQSPDHAIAFALDNIAADASLHYKGERHWATTLSFQLHKNKLSLVVPGTKTPFVVGADEVWVAGLHFDTEKLAKILTEIADVKSADESGQVVLPSVWIDLVQQFLTQLINNDTSFHVRDLSLTAPSGQILLHYDASFPALPMMHDYFDISTRDVSQFALAIPDWTYVDQASKTAFGLSHFKLTSSNNTIFSRDMRLEIGAFDMKDLLAQTGTPILYATGFTYHGHNYGDIKTFSQVLTWHLNQLCFSNECFKSVKGGLNLLNLNFTAFRGIALATQQMIAFDPNGNGFSAARWSDLGAAYMGLITPDTRIVFSHDMQTPAGEMKVYAAANWPHFSTPAGLTPNPDLFWSDIHYQVHAVVPVDYVKAYLAHEKMLEKQVPVLPGQKIPALPPTVTMQAASIVQYAITQGYLKQIGDVYAIDLDGKGTEATLNGVAWH